MDDTEIGGMTSVWMTLSALCFMIQYGKLDYIIEWAALANGFSEFCGFPQGPPPYEPGKLDLWR